MKVIIGLLFIVDFRRYGVPTIRTDLPAPRIRRVDDRKNYGDESDAYGLVNPSLFSQKGVYEKDFLLPRSKEEVRVCHSLKLFFFYTADICKFLETAISFTVNFGFP